MDSLIEGVARVIAAEGDRVWLEPEQTNSCGGCVSASTCASKTGMGQKSLANKRFALVNDFHAMVGDRVVVGFSEYALLRASGIAYAVPLLTMLAAAVVANLAIGGDGPVALGAIGGLLGGLAFARRRAAGLTAKGELTPRFLRLASSGLDCPTD